MVAFAVTTRAVVWIEMTLHPMRPLVILVTTRAVVWIEIGGIGENTADGYSHHPCGGVD